MYACKTIPLPPNVQAIPLDQVTAEEGHDHTSPLIVVLRELRVLIPHPQSNQVWLGQKVQEKVGLEGHVAE